MKIRREGKGANTGFTLIEMSIVLVIIGLLVAAIFAGNMLVQSAKIRKTISQKERFDVATMTFIGKYKALPGDISNYQIFGGVTRTRAAGRGDGDWVVKSSSSAPQQLSACGETLMFWRDLSDTGTLQDIQSQGTDGTTAGSACLPVAVTVETGLSRYLPLSPLAPNMFWMINAQGNGISTTESSDPRRNYYDLMGMVGVSTGGMPTPFDLIPSDVALVIDTKLDDGLPLSGKVRATSVYSAGFTAQLNTAPAANCATGGVYVTTNGLYCSMRFDIGF